MNTLNALRMSRLMLCLGAVASFGGVEADATAVPRSAVAPVATNAADVVASQAFDYSVCSPTFGVVAVCSLRRQMRQEWLDRHHDRPYPAGRQPAD